MANVFLNQLKSTEKDFSHKNRGDATQVRFVPYDQLNPKVWMDKGVPEDWILIFIETSWKPAQRPYHKQKLYWILAHQRMFALECAKMGYQIDYRFSSESYQDVLEDLSRHYPTPIYVSRCAEYEMREALQPAILSGDLIETEHHGWLTQTELFLRAQVKSGYKMDTFYRLARQEIGLLMEGTKPVGGQYSFDSENRERISSNIAIPPRPIFTTGDLEAEVAALIQEKFAEHPGTLNSESVPVSRSDVGTYWSWFKQSCLDLFGPYQDAMVSGKPFLFHSLVSTLIHLHRIMPSEACYDVAESTARLNSKEGFIRQVLGWREFIRHTHEHSDGFRDFSRVHNPSHLAARPNVLNQTTTLPLVFWDSIEKPSGLHCLDSVIEDVWRHGYTHHIGRLMILSNIAQLLDVDPYALSHWFWIAYIDAFDWVVEPNVLAMGTFALGDWMTTKPYISGAAYINRMSNYCGECSFHPTTKDPEKRCPITPLYWAYLDRHQNTLSGNYRMSMPLRALEKKSNEERVSCEDAYKVCVRKLSAGNKLEPLGQSTSQGKSRILKLL